MRAFFLLVAKEFAELILNPRALFVMVLVPPVILVLVGRLQIRPPDVRVVVSGMQDCEGDESVNESGLRTYRYLEELSWVEVACEAELERAPLRRLQQGGIDLLLNIDDGLEGRWVIYLADTNPRRIRWRLRLAQGIQVSRRELSNAEEATTLLYKMSTLGAMPLRSASHYYPQSGGRLVAMLPGTFGLILCFLPFVIAAPSLIREREGHTLEALLSGPGVRADMVPLSKGTAAVGASLVSAILMLLTIQMTYHVYVKSNLVLFGLFLVLPILSSALLGLTVSALARTQAQTMIAAAVYFLCLLLLSGFLYPLEGSAGVVQFVSLFLGFTHLVDPANEWMFGADFTRGLGRSLLLLSLQSAAYGVLAWRAWRWLRRRI